MVGVECKSHNNSSCSKMSRAGALEQSLSIKLSKPKICNIKKLFSIYFLIIFFQRNFKAIIIWTNWRVQSLLPGWAVPGEGPGWLVGLSIFLVVYLLASLAATYIYCNYCRARTRSI